MTNLPFTKEVLIQEVNKRLKSKTPVDIQLPEMGRLKIEHKLPFLLVYRPGKTSDPKIARLLTGEASYLIAPENEPDTKEINGLLKIFSRILSKTFGAVILIEIWEGKPASKQFVIKTAKGIASETVTTLNDELNKFCKVFPELGVALEYTRERHPPQLEPLMTPEERQEAGIFLIGIEIPPIYKNFETKEFYYLRFRGLKKRLSAVFRKTIYQFIRVQTSSDIESYHALGSRSLGSTVWEVDRQLTAIEDSFRFLLLISPINTLASRDEFAKKKFRENPEFLYRFLPIDPDYLKEQLYSINVRDIEDPTLGFLYRDKREELDKQLTMLSERGTKNFMYSSLRLYESVDATLLKQAREILTKFPSLKTKTQKWVDCFEMADRVRKEIAWYRQFYEGFDSTVSIKHDVIGIMVSKGQVLIGESFKVPANRVEALLHHEVGTHVLTYYNGKAQPLKQLYNGWANYDELQEGLAVLTEYLTGGLTRGRLRLLAARVVAAHSLVEGADFCDTFHELKHIYGFELGTAFDVTARIHQGGGCTKDIIYLRGLIRLLNYLKEGGDIKPLFVGKIAAKHIPLMEELRYREILKPIPVYPRYLQQEEAISRLDKARQGLSVDDLLADHIE